MIWIILGIVALSHAVTGVAFYFYGFRHGARAGIERTLDEIGKQERRQKLQRLSTRVMIPREDLT